MKGTMYLHPNIDLDAVENFICTIDRELPLGMHLMSLQYDSWAYKWNRVTVSAIKEELCEIYNVPLVKTA